jgi:hypothetical protein
MDDVDVQRPRSSSHRQDAESEELRVERADAVAALAYRRAKRSFVVAFVALGLAVAAIAMHYL